MKIRGNTITILQRSLLLAGGKMTGVLRTPAILIDPVSGVSRAVRFVNESGKYDFSLYPSTEGLFQVAQYEPETRNYETYHLPAVTAGITANAVYKILTSKEAVSVAEGGTGANTAAKALKNLGALSSSGGSMTGELHMNSNPISGLKAPTANDQAANKGYVDEANGKCVSKSGDTMTGTLVVASNNSGVGYQINKTVDGSVHSYRVYLTAGGVPVVYYYKDGAVMNRMALYDDETYFDQPVSIASGGTAAKTAADARKNIGAVAMATRTVSLPKASWSSKKQTVSVSGVTADNAVIVAPAAASFANYRNNGIRCTAQASGTLTFQCDTVPTADVSVNVLILT